MIHDLQDYARQGFQFVWDWSGDYNLRVFHVASSPTVKVYDGEYFGEAFVACAEYLKEKQNG